MKEKKLVQKLENLQGSIYKMYFKKLFFKVFKDQLIFLVVKLQEN